MLKDTEFLEQLAKTKAEFEPLDGEAMQTFARSMRDLSPALIERARLATKLVQ
jgi:hypothetical protein